MERNRLALFAVFFSTLLSECYLSQDKSQQHEELPPKGKVEVGDAENREAIPDKQIDRPSDAMIQLETSDVSISEEGINLEDIEMCLAAITFWGDEAKSVMTDDQGRYTFEYPGFTISMSQISELILAPRKTGLDFSPLSITLNPEEIDLTKGLSALVSDDFIVTRIKEEPHSMGQWRVVESTCPLENNSTNIVPPPLTGPTMFCPGMVLGSLLTFKDGCLLDEQNINCVRENLYTSGVPTCSARNVSAGSPPFKFEGYFDKDTERWYITSNRCLGMGVMGGTCASGEFVLEPVDD